MFVLQVIIKSLSAVTDPVEPNIRRGELNVRFTVAMLQKFNAEKFHYSLFII